MMKQKPRLLVYTRKEIGILVALGLMVSIFSFTFGIHLGKKVASKPPAETNASVPLAETAKDQLPNRQELDEQAKEADPAADEVATQALHEEVTRTGIKLETPRQVDLPQESKAEKKAITHSVAASRELHAKKVDRPGNHQAPMPQLFSLQVGSFPNFKEAQHLKIVLAGKGLKPMIKSGPAPGKGSRHRVLVGPYPSKRQAKKAGAGLVKKGVIKSYLVVAQS